MAPASVKISRRALLGTSAAAAILKAVPAEAQTAPPPLVLDDASRLNKVPVARHWRPTQVTGEAWLDALRAELKSAAAAGRAVSVGAARHSMGGQALARDGVAMTLDVKPDGASSWISIDRGAKTFRVAAGARWRQVITALDAQGFSPAVMQSNHDFGVAATLCVNAHGWPAPYGPFGTTVRSFRLMLASGDLVACSPAENPELFALVTGGYGLFGVVVDLEPALTENVLLAPTWELMPAAQLGPRMVASIERDPSVRMAYGRLAVDSQRFLRESLLVTLRPVAGPPPPATSGGLMVTLSREVFRAQIGSDVAKRARWYAETASALWAALAAWRSTRATIIFFRVFGTLYCLDGLLGLATGSGYLDLGILKYGVLDLPLMTRVLMNLPHIVIGGLAAFAGFGLASRWASPAHARG